MQSGAIAQSRITSITAVLASVIAPCPPSSVAVMEPPVAPAKKGRGKKDEEPFTAPKDFLEFRDRFMRPEYNYVRTFVRKALLARKMGDHLLDDYEAEMVLWLVTPVKGSGKVDRIAYFDQNFGDGAATTQGHFLKFVKGVMSNKLSNLLKKARKDAALSDRTVQHNQFDTPMALADEGTVAEPYTAMVGHTTRRNADKAFLDLDWDTDIRLALDSFKSHLRATKPRLLRAFDLFLDFETTSLVADAAGVTKRTARLWQAALVEEFSCFKNKRRNHR